MFLVQVKCLDWLLKTLKKRDEQHKGELEVGVAGGCGF